MRIWHNSINGCCKAVLIYKGEMAGVVMLLLRIKIHHPFNTEFVPEHPEI